MRCDTMLPRHSRPTFPRDMLGLAVPAGVVPPVDGNKPDAAQHRLDFAAFERGFFPAGTRQTTDPFFCAPSWDATAACKIFRKCSKPLSCKTVSTQAIPLPCGAAFTASVRLRMVSTADSAASSSAGDNVLKSKPIMILLAHGGRFYCWRERRHGRFGWRENSCGVHRAWRVRRDATALGAGIASL